MVSIGPSAFAAISSLNSVTIPDSVTSIGTSAFQYCNGLTNIAIGNGVASIGNNAFQNCNGLFNVTVGSGVTSIGSGAFGNCGYLVYVTIGSAVTSIGTSAFANCTGLVRINFQGNAPGNSTDSTVFSGDYDAFVYYLPGTTGWNQTFDGLTTMLWNLPSPYSYVTNNGAITITGYTGTNGIVTIPGAIYSAGPTNFLPVTAIGPSAFANCPTLVSVIFPNSITNFGSHAFSGCTNLLGAFFVTNAPSADSTVFSGDDNARAYYLAGTTGWGQTFGGIQTVLPPFILSVNTSGLTFKGYTGPGGGVSIPDMIGGLPVNNSGLTIKGYTGPGGAVFIPDTIGGLPVVNIGPAAFAFNGLLTSVAIPDTVTNIGIFAFWNCTNLATVTISTNVTSIGASDFDSCISLTSVVIPNSVTKVGGSAFQSCASLTNVTIGNGVATIGNGAFDACASLTRIMVDPQNMNFGSVDGALVNKSRNTLVQCPGGKTGIYTVPNSVVGIGSFAFDSSTGLTNITIPASVPSIGEWAFASCFGLTSLTIPNTVTNLGSYAFESCAALKSVTIPDTVTTIGYHAFDGCTSLTDATIGYRLTTIPSSTLSGSFSGCSSLTSIYLVSIWSAKTPFFVWNPTNEIATPTAYFLPGAVTNFITGLPMALWLPQVQSDDASFGFQANQFGFTINWASSGIVEVDACTNLAQAAWTPGGNHQPPQQQLILFQRPAVDQLSQPILPRHWICFTTINENHGFQREFQEAVRFHLD